MLLNRKKNKSLIQYFENKQLLNIYSISMYATFVVRTMSTITT